MQINSEQDAILKGVHGEVISRALKTLVDYGTFFNAKRLVPIKSAHLAGSFGAVSYGAYFQVIDQMLKEGTRVKVPTTINPRPGRDVSLLNKIAFRKQKTLDDKLRALGVIQSYTCACYEHDNVPTAGACLAWAESSAVVFSNSVLGARTNRNSVLIDLCSAITGYTPEFGYLLDENRFGNVVVTIKINQMDAAALGFIIGQRIINGVPVIEHFDFSRSDLKNMGAAMAAAGNIGLFHVEGLTPDACDMHTAFAGAAPRSVITITQSDLNSLRATHLDRSNLIVFGCPHLTCKEASDIAARLAGKRLKKYVWLCMIPQAKRDFEKTRYYKLLDAAHVTVNCHCPLSALTIQMRRKKVLTPSGKLYYYLEGAEYGTMEDCFKACEA